jgi:hypothetical protein
MGRGERGQGSGERGQGTGFEIRDSILGIRDWRMGTVVASALFGLGGLICCLNLYWSFLRYPFHRLRGGAREDCRHVSSCPLFGSLLVAISLLQLWSHPVVLAIVATLILIDTGGLPWLLGVMA